jgi:hypothetical protein
VGVCDVGGAAVGKRGGEGGSERFAVFQWIASGTFDAAKGQQVKVQSNALGFQSVIFFEPSMGSDDDEVPPLQASVF